MYSIDFVYNDFQKFRVEIDDEYVDTFMKNITSSQPYFNEDKSMGFWAPTNCLRAVHINKKPIAEPQEINSCHPSQSWEPELASTS